MHMPDSQTPDVQTHSPQRRRRNPQPQENTQKNTQQTRQRAQTVQAPKKKRSRMLARTAMGVAVLLAMAGRAMAGAVKRIKGEHLRMAAMALCAMVAVVSAWQVGGIVLRSARTKRLNESLSQQRAAIVSMHSEEPETAAALTPAPEIQPTAAPLPEKQERSAEAVPLASAAPDVVKTTKYRQVGGEALEEMAGLHAQNHDLVAWIQIPDVLDLPVVYRDNDYYLTRDFSRQKNASGTIFLDENHPFKEKTQNLLLHGHNMKDNTMFGRLAQYLYDDTYLRNHPIIYLDTLWQKEQYVIFAVLDVSLNPSDPRFFNYFTHDTFSSDAEFAMYIRQLQLRSRYAIPIDVEPSDALLTLSTCLDDDRLVIVCRRLRENETRSELRTLIRMATKQ